MVPPVPVSELFKLVDFKLVHWGLWTEIFSTWAGMVFVVSFASCLDVAAISIDMGEALDTNHELATVGICNREFRFVAQHMRQSGFLQRNHANKYLTLCFPCLVQSCRG